jgi:hypothetical protein
MLLMLHDYVQLILLLCQWYFKLQISTLNRYQLNHIYVCTKTLGEFIVICN